MERKSIFTRSQANSTNKDPRTLTDVMDTTLPADTPEWGKSVFNLLNGAINSLDEKVNKLINNLELSIKDTAVKADEAKDLAESNKSEIDTLVTKCECLSTSLKNNFDSVTSKIKHLSEAVEFLMDDTKRQDENILNNESYSRRDNILFRGFTVNPEDQETCETKVRNILKSMDIHDDIPFVRCHYMNGQKQIIVRLQWHSDRVRIWRNRYKLKGTNIFIAEDFPSAIDRQRKQMFPVMKAAQQLPQFARKASMRGNQLILNGKHYTCDNLHEVPDAVNPSKLAEKSNDNVMVFGGSTSSQHMLSNFYKVKEKFVYEHIEYNTAEQAYQHKKSRTAGDQNVAREIMFNPDGSTQKFLGQKIKGLDQKKWDAEKRHHMKDIIVAKFNQCDDLRKASLDTGKKQLAEANARDSFYGIGIPLTHRNVLNPKMWPKGSNQLGLILMEVREELKNSENQDS